MGKFVVETSFLDSKPLAQVFTKKTLSLQPFLKLESFTKTIITMGKGDKRSLRGKINRSSYGNARPKKGKKVAAPAKPA
jgi:ribosomal small subunit protein bTHX